MPSSTPSNRYPYSQTPQLGFGTGTTWFKDGDESHPTRGDLDTNLISIIKAALHRGFVHLDCAQSYGNEKEVGIAIRESGVAREKLFITSKVQDGVADIPSALEGSLERLQTGYLDLYDEFHLEIPSYS